MCPYQKKVKRCGSIDELGNIYGASVRRICETLGFSWIFLLLSAPWPY